MRLSKKPDLLFGSVTAIEASAADPFMKVYLEMLSDVSHVRFITIMKTP